MRLNALLLAAAVLVLGCGGVEGEGAELPAAPEATPAVDNDRTVRAQTGPYRSVTSADISKRIIICGSGVPVSATAGGPAFCSLTYPQTFTVGSISGDYVYGMAWGTCNQQGWIENGWFCN